MTRRTAFLTFVLLCELIWCAIIWITTTMVMKSGHCRKCTIIVPIQMPIPPKGLPTFTTRDHFLMTISINGWVKSLWNHQRPRNAMGNAICVGTSTCNCGYQCFLVIWVAKCELVQRLVEPNMMFDRWYSTVFGRIKNIGVTSTRYSVQTFGSIIFRFRTVCNGTIVW
jgi:hypothetical protein